MAWRMTVETVKDTYTVQIDDPEERAAIEQFVKEIITSGDGWIGVPTLTGGERIVSVRHVVVVQFEAIADVSA
jgi:hypothetical protein